MEMIDEVVDDDHFVEVTISAHEMALLIKRDVLKAKILVNNEVISFAIIVECDKEVNCM